MAVAYVPVHDLSVRGVSGSTSAAFLPTFHALFTLLFSSDGFSTPLLHSDASSLTLALGIDFRLAAPLFSFASCASADVVTVFPRRLLPLPLSLPLSVRVLAVGLPSRESRRRQAKHGRDALLEQLQQRERERDGEMVINP